MAENQDINAKIIAGIERLSDVIKTLIWEKAKVYGLSPIQINMLRYFDDHEPALCTVSHLAKTFNLTKATVSDAVRVLLNKDLVAKDTGVVDKRSFHLVLTKAGHDLIEDLNAYTTPLNESLNGFHPGERSGIYEMLVRLIYDLNKSGVLQVQRVCLGCRYYSSVQGSHHCRLLDLELGPADLRLDCPEFESRHA